MLKHHTLLRNLFQTPSIVRLPNCDDLSLLGFLQPINFSRIVKVYNRIKFIMTANVLIACVLLQIRSRHRCCAHVYWGNLPKRMAWSYRRFEPTSHYNWYFSGPGEMLGFSCVVFSSKRFVYISRSSVCKQSWEMKPCGSGCLHLRQFPRSFKWPPCPGYPKVQGIFSLIKAKKMKLEMVYLIFCRSYIVASRQCVSDIFQSVLVKIRGTDNVANEMDDMRQEADSEQAAGQMTIVQLFRDRTVRWQLISVLILMVCQQLSGINAVSFETVDRVSRFVRSSE